MKVDGQEFKNEHEVFMGLYKEILHVVGFIRLTGGGYCPTKEEKRCLKGMVKTLKEEFEYFIDKPMRKEE